MLQRKKEELSIFLNKYSIYLVLAVMAAFMSFCSRDFLTLGNIMNLLLAESIRGILALGVGLVIISKGIDLSVGSIVALSAVITASLVQDPTYANRVFPDLPQMPLAVGVMAGIAVGLIIGAFSGMMVAYHHIPPFIATLGAQVIARGLVYTFTNAYPVPMLRPDFKSIGQGKLFAIPNLAIYFVLIALLAMVLLKYTRFGKNLYAIGGNETAAKVAGINVGKNLMAVYMWSAGLAALAGILLAARSGSGLPSMGEGYELDAIAAATIGGVSHSGGVGTVGGIVVGILILGILNNGLLLLGVSPYLQQIIKGIIIVGAVTFDMRKKSRRS